MRFSTLIMALWLTPTFSGCFVDAGNPHGKKDKPPKQGSLSVTLVQANFDKLSKFTLPIAGINLRAADAVYRISRFAEPKRADVLAQSSDPLVENAATDAGVFTGIVLQLVQDEAIFALDQNGGEVSIDYQDEDKTIDFPLNFKLDPGESSHVFIVLDLSKSLEFGETGQSATFAPQTAVNQGSVPSTSLSGVVEDKEVTTVCFFETTVTAPERDANRDCATALGRAEVKDGMYEIDAIPIAPLKVRVFRGSDADFYDLPIGPLLIIAPSNTWDVPAEGSGLPSLDTED